MKNLPQLGDLTTMKNTDFIIFEERTNNKKGSKKNNKNTNKTHNKNTNKTHNKRTNKKRKSSTFFGLFK